MHIHVCTYSLSNILKLKTFFPCATNHNESFCGDD